MIHINPNAVYFAIPTAWLETSTNLSAQLLGCDPAIRATLIETGAAQTWRADELLTAFRSIVGNKCWYTEVMIDGADPNIDHFRPKGSIREIDDEQRIVKGSSTEGYWWLAFDYRNFRLSSQHANQRRVDKSTNGGKWDFFPVQGARAPEGTPVDQFAENALVIDPWSLSDVRLLAFDTSGTPIYSAYRGVENDFERQKVITSIWLYHLNKQELVTRRGQAMRKIDLLLQHADAQYGFWERHSQTPRVESKAIFDLHINELMELIDARSEFAGAKRYALRSSLPKYDWIEEFLQI